MAGTLKYFYLVFSEPNEISLDDYGKSHDDPLKILLYWPKEHAEKARFKIGQFLTSIQCSIPKRTLSASRNLKASRALPGIV